jgi:iron complex transport system ATP-binding protein
MVLGARSLTLTVPGRTLVEGLDFALAPGECWALLGPNGAGKTSLLHALAGLRPPDGGAVELDGRPVASFPRREFARRVGVLLQEETESFWGSVLEYVLLGRLPHDAGLFAPDARAAEAARAALGEVDLAGRAAQPYRTLSGGERQRARLAQLRVQGPAVWLLDEPLAHLDLGHQLAAMELARRLARDGRAVAMALHEPLWAARYCGHALLMYDSGRFRHGPVQEVLTQENLEALYGCRLAPAAAETAPLFLPIAST